MTNKTLDNMLAAGVGFNSENGFSFTADTGGILRIVGDIGILYSALYHGRFFIFCEIIPDNARFFFSRSCLYPICYNPFHFFQGSLVISA